MSGDSGHRRARSRTGLADAPLATIEAMTSRAARAYDDLVARIAQSGDDTLTGLLGEYQTRTKGVPTRQLSRLKAWSAKYGWRARIAQVQAEAADEQLAQAAIIDAETFLKSSRLLAERMNLSTPLHVDAIVKIRESVRKPQPTNSAGVNVGVQTTVVQIVAPEGE